MNTTITSRRLPAILGIAAAAFMALASIAGILVPMTYARETTLWAAQAIGQDYVNLFVAAPALLLTSVALMRGQKRYEPVWRGLMLYVLYSYVLYALFVHFNHLFLIYVATLGVSFYGLAIDFTQMNKRDVQQCFVEPLTRLAVSLLLFVGALLFGMAWLREVIAANLSGSIPVSAQQIGAFVNPVHVLDLAFVLPAMLICAVLLWRKNGWGFVMAGPLLVFVATMGLAISGMWIAQRINGVDVAGGMMLVMVTIVVLSVLCLARYMSEYRPFKATA